LAPALVLFAARRHQESLNNPRNTPAEYLDALEKEGLTEIVAILREYVVGD
jgi:hypothetical protein